MIVEKIREAKKRKIKQWPVNTNRASELGHECLRYLVLNRTCWQEKTLHSPELQMTFEIGHLIEEAFMNDMREAGITVVEQQRAFSWAKYQITGTIDCKVAVDGGDGIPAGVYPADVKSSAPHPFESLTTIQDMLHHKYHYIRKYPAQLALYMLMDNKDFGVFLFKQKVNGAPKEIWMKLDYDFAESLVQKAEAINKHVAEGTLPEPMDYQDDICADCGFVHICMPDRIGKEIEVVDDGELLELVPEYMALKPSAKRYEDVDKRISELVKGREKILVGDYFIEGKWTDRKSYEVPDEIKQQYEVVSQSWRKKIMRVSA